MKAKKEFSSEEIATRLGALRLRKVSLLGMMAKIWTTSALSQREALILSLIYGSPNLRKIAQSKGILKELLLVNGA